MAHHDRQHTRYQKLARLRSAKQTSRPLDGTAYEREEGVSIDVRNIHSHTQTSYSESHDTHTHTDNDEWCGGARLLAK